MATRPVFEALARAPFVLARPVEFHWFPGMAVAQVQRSIASLHAAAQGRGLGPVLDVSTKSPSPLGASLSSFVLEFRGAGVRAPVESLYQGSKVFAEGGPFQDLYSAAPGDAKRDPRLRTSGPLMGFQFHAERFPTSPVSAFYDWLYMNALADREDLLAEIGAYRSFSDIVFNPEKSVSSQASAIARFLGLHRAGLVRRALSSFASLVSLAYAPEAPPRGPTQLLFDV